MNGLVQSICCRHLKRMGIPILLDRVIQKDQIDEVIDNIQYPMSLFSVYLLNYLQRKEGI